MAFLLRITLPLVLLGGQVTACANSVASRLEGRWLGDSISNVDAAQLAAAIGWVRGTSFEFGSSNLTVAIPTEIPRTGPYQVLKAEERDVIISVQREDGAVDTAHLTLDSDDQLRWHIGEGRSIVLRRMR